MSCSLVPDVVYRNVTQKWFDEKCWTVEEELCRTVYDTVWDKKFEVVNITVPQRECDSHDSSLCHCHESGSASGWFKLEGYLYLVFVLLLDLQ